MRAQSRRPAATPARWRYCAPMSPDLHAAEFARWRPTCDTLHAHTQVLGKLAAANAPREPRLQHAALRITARGWETAPLPAPDGSGAFAVALDLRSHEALAEHSDGRLLRVALGPDRAVGEVTRELLGGLSAMVGEPVFDPQPQEVPWSTPLDQDEEHCTYDSVAVAAYFAVATEAALALNEVRAAHPGVSTPVNAWWGSFDIAVSLFAAEPAVELAIGWWPGDERHPAPAMYAYANPAPEGFSQAALQPPAAGWHQQLGEFVMPWPGPGARAGAREAIVTFARSAAAAAGGGFSAVTAG